jgi:hypothetical protein
MDEAVREQGGFVRGFTGGGIMAVFGAPVALEDAPLRACRAALNILQRLKATGPDLVAKHPPPLHVEEATESFPIRQHPAILFSLAVAFWRQCSDFSSGKLHSGAAKSRRGFP